MSRSDIQYLFDYVRDLQKQVNQLKVAVLTGKTNGLELPNPIHLEPGEKIPLGHLADDLLDTELRIIEKLRENIPKMSDFDKGYILGKTESFSEKKEECKKKE